jgi:hypothetical protein
LGKYFAWRVVESLTVISREQIVVPRGLPQDRHRFGGIVRIEDHLQMRIGIGGIPWDNGADHRLDVGRLEYLLESQGYAGCKGTDGRSAPPSFKALGW